MAEGPQLKSATVKRGKDAPAKMCRGSAAAGDGKCYFVSEKDTELRMYDTEKDDWFSLRACPYKNSTLTVIDGLLTAVGGYKGSPSCSDYEFTNVLYSLSNRRWIEKFPPMIVDPALGVNSKKENAAVVQSGSSVIVIAGRTEDQPQKRVDILDTKTLQWSEAPELPDYSSIATAAICGDELFVVNDTWGQWVRQCFLDELTGVSKPAGDVWSTVKIPPHEYGTCASLCGQLVVIGGKGRAAGIHAYDSAKDSWYQIGKLALGRSKPLVAQLSEDKVVVVGGQSSDFSADVPLTEIVTGVV